MTKFNFLFGLKICEHILLSRALQKSSLPAAEVQHIASLTVSTLTKIRTDQLFQLFFTLVKKLSQDHKVGEPVLPRRERFQDIWMIWMMVMPIAVFSLRQLRIGIELPTLKLWTWSLKE